MIIVIEGRRQEGKTHLSFLISKNKKKAFINPEEIGSKFAFASIEKDTDFIIVDDIIEKDFKNIYSFFKKENILIQKRGEKNCLIKTPNIILIKL